jgi:predicted dehydrogenase
MRTTAVALFALFPLFAQETKPLRLVIVGRAHGHVAGFLNNAQRRTDLQIVATVEPGPDLGAALDKLKPEAVAIFTATLDHAPVVEACAARHIPVMMEKPLAVSNAEARKIRQAAARTGTPVIVNYETTWYRNHAEIWKMFKQQKSAGEIRKMVAMDGHQGPKEINVQPEFLAWLTDPVKNGAGALFDFGCYGANLMTWLMDNQKPLKVTALAQTEKPQIYAHVDDEATILLEYPKAQGIIQASWNWPFNRKDLEVYGETGYAIAGTGGNELKVRFAGRREESRVPAPLPPDEADSISYLIAVARGKVKPSGLSSLENNMIVTEILDAARESVRTGKTVALK